jgi:general secretion pathway protein G
VLPQQRFETGAFGCFPQGRRVSAIRGFTLIELLLVVVIIGALAALAIPNLQEARERAQIAAAIGDIRAIGQSVTEYYLDNSSYPADLGPAGFAGFQDPWGNPYEYLPVPGSPIGALRKDQFLVPINSDFDLYSAGPDGASQPPLAAAPSWDDIVRANDGGFIGVAEDY